MAKLETEHVFEGSVENVFKALGQYERYPQYIPGVTKVEVLPAIEDGSTCQVRYELNIVKTFYYVLNMYAEEPGKVWWDLAESNLMKTNDGSWDLSKKGADETKAIYSLDIKFKGLVPSTVTNKVAKSSLPAMFSGFQKMIDEV